MPKVIGILLFEAECPPCEKGRAARRDMEVKAMRDPSGLSIKQAKFVEAYLRTGNAGESYKEAGYTGKNPRTGGYDVMSKPSVKKAIEEGLAQQRRDAQFGREKVLEAIQDIASFDLADIVSIGTDQLQKGNIDPRTGQVLKFPVTVQTVDILDTRFWPKRARTSVKSIKQGKYGIEVEFYSKADALQSLTKLYAMGGQMDEPDGHESDLLKALPSALDTSSIPEIEGDDAE